MKRISFGLLRWIEIFDEGSGEEENVWDNFIEKVVFKDKINPGYLPFGVVNDMHPLMFEKHTGKIYVYDPLADEIVLVACSREQFDQIISGVMDIWKDHQHVAILKRDRETMDKYKLFKAEYGKLKEIHFEWWVNFALKELNINLII